jgi:hypothetical protein
MPGAPPVLDRRTHCGQKMLGVFDALGRRQRIFGGV